MSMDKSLKSKNLLQRHRNVLTRAERIAALKDTNRWTEESRPIGLPKVTHRKAAVGKKDKEKKKGTEAEAEATTEEKEQA